MARTNPTFPGLSTLPGRCGKNVRGLTRPVCADSNARADVEATEAKDGWKSREVVGEAVSRASVWKPFEAEKGRRQEQFFCESHTQGYGSSG